MRLRDLLIVALLAACKREQAAEQKPVPPAVRAPAAPAAPVESDRIPRTTGPIKIDGEWDEEDWSKRAGRHQFLGDDGQLARPSSEVRLLHDDKDLYVGLYAGDENIQSTTDAFDVTVGAVSLRVDATGKVTPAREGVRAGIDRDGTLDDPKDNDEEWVIELAIPLDSLGLAPGKRTDVKASRCDVTKDGVKRCGSWSGSLLVE